MLFGHGRDFSGVDRGWGRIYLGSGGWCDLHWDEQVRLVSIVFIKHEYRVSIHLLSWTFPQYASVDSQLGSKCFLI